MNKEVAKKEQKPLIHSYYMNFAEDLPNIFDWATKSQPLPDVSSYDASSAMEASDEWHRMMAGEGEGKAEGVVLELSPNLPRLLCLQYQHLMAILNCGAFFFPLFQK